MGLDLARTFVIENELGRLAGDPILLIPSSRPSWRSIPTQ